MINDWPFQSPYRHEEVKLNGSPCAFRLDPKPDDLFVRIKMASGKIVVGCGAPPNQQFVGY
jgi:hypothetical protein